MPSKRSNKTARVLNLIAGSHQPEATESPEAQDVPAEAPAAPVEEVVAPPEEKPARKSSSRTRSTAKKAKQPAQSPPVEETIPEQAPAAAEPVPAPSATLPPAPQPIVPIVQTVREKEQALAEDIRAGLLQALSESEDLVDFSEPSAAPSDTPAPEPAESATAPAAEASIEPILPEEPAPAPETVPTPSVPEDVASEPEEKSPEEAPSDDAAASAVSAADTALAQKIAAELSAQEDNQTPVSSAPVLEAVSESSLPPEPKVSAPSEVLDAAEKPSAGQDVSYWNVLQTLVEENAAYYTKHMLQCTCPRCIADMKALALTNLPSKYVVLSQAQKNAYMSVFGARYANEIAVQMVRACVIVNDHPHHGDAL
ncbi:MAG: late competence development ComFB family protein [Butyricicoccus sp.]|nr:late competence development ComFB family protein [Butyricicoccus sp.]